MVTETLEDYMINMVDDLERNHIYEVATDAVRANIDVYKMLHSRASTGTKFKQTNHGSMIS